MTKPICSFPECGRRVHALGLCAGHRAQLRRSGTLVPIAEYATCAADGCAKSVRFAPLCKVHGDRMRAHGRTELLVRPTLAERFWEKVDKSSDCWLWTGTKSRLGYGRIVHDGLNVGTHRISLLLAGVEIPDGYDVDHLCRVPSCVNPAHLEPVTHAENMARAPFTGAHWQSAKTHCPSGHEYNESNTIVGRKGRRCRQCKADDARRRRERRKIAQAS